MTFDAFKRRVNALIQKAGGEIHVLFSTDEETGKHYASCSDGVIIIGNEGCKRVEVRWGSGHAGLATI